MKEETKSILAKGNLEFEIVNHVGVLTLKKNVFEMVTDLSESSDFFGLLEKSKSVSDIHAILIINESGCLDTQRYSEFLKKVIDEDTKNGFKLSTGVARTRQIVNLNNFIRRAKQILRSWFL